MQNLTYELTFLEDTLEPLLAGKKEIAKSDLTTIDAECRRLKKLFVRLIPGTARQVLEDYFRLHYTVLRGWCEEVYGLGTRDTRAPKPAGQVMSDRKADVISEPVLHQLDDLLHFMETHLADYVRKPEYLTRYRAETQITRIGERLEALRPSMDEHLIGEKLRTAISRSLTCSDKPRHQIAGGKMSYCNQLIDRTVLLLAGLGLEDDAEEAITQLLIRYNLNSASFFNYYAKQPQRIEDMPLHHQQAYWVDWKREVAMTYREPGISYQPDAPHIADQLVAAFEEEMVKLRRLEKINLRLQYRAEPEDTFRSSLTARQMAMFVRLLIETGIILVNEPRRLFDFVCRHFRSIAADHLSPDSFYKNAHKKLAKDVERVGEVVKDMGDAVEELGK